MEMYVEKNGKQGMEKKRVSFAPLPSDSPIALRRNIRDLEEKEGKSAPVEVGRVGWLIGCGGDTTTDKG